MKESTRHARPLNSKGNGENVFMKDWYQFPAEPERGETLTFCCIPQVGYQLTEVSQLHLAPARSTHA